MMSISERRLDREGKRERAYTEAEYEYFAKNMRPDDINYWFWCAMWGRFPMRNSKEEAIRDAREAAVAVGVVMTVDEWEFDWEEGKGPEKWFWAEPTGLASLGWMYREARIQAVKTAVIEGTYPDYKEVASYASDPSGARRHFEEYERHTHQRWREEAAQKSGECGV